MSSREFRHYTRDEFLAEIYPDPAEKAAIAAGMQQLRADRYRAARRTPPRGTSCLGRATPGHRDRLPA